MALRSDGYSRGRSADELNQDELLQAQREGTEREQWRKEEEEWERECWVSDDCPCEGSEGDWFRGDGKAGLQPFRTADVERDTNVMEMDRSDANDRLKFPERQYRGIRKGSSGVVGPGERSRERPAQQARVCGWEASKKRGMSDCVDSDVEKWRWREDWEHREAVRRKVRSSPQKGERREETKKEDSRGTLRAEGGERSDEFGCEDWTSCKTRGYLGRSSPRDRGQTRWEPTERDDAAATGRQREVDLEHGWERPPGGTEKRYPTDGVKLGVWIAGSGRDDLADTRREGGKETKTNWNRERDVAGKWSRDREVWHEALCRNEQHPDDGQGKDRGLERHMSPRLRSLSHTRRSQERDGAWEGRRREESREAWKEDCREPWREGSREERGRKGVWHGGGKHERAPSGSRGRRDSAKRRSPRREVWEANGWEEQKRVLDVKASSSGSSDVMAISLCSPATESPTISLSTPPPTARSSASTEPGVNLNCTLVLSVHAGALGGGPCLGGRSPARSASVRLPASQKRAIAGHSPKHLPDDTAAISAAPAAYSAQGAAAGASAVEIPSWVGVAPDDGFKLQRARGDGPEALRLGGRRGLVVGRSSCASLRLLSMSCSRTHALIAFHKKQQQVVVMDLGSARGTFLDGMRLDAKLAVPLREGNVLRFGDGDAAELYVVAAMLGDPVPGPDLSKPHAGRLADVSKRACSATLSPPCSPAGPDGVNECTLKSNAAAKLVAQHARVHDVYDSMDECYDYAVEEPALVQGQEEKKKRAKRSKAGRKSSSSSKIVLATDWQQGLEGLDSDSDVEPIACERRGVVGCRDTQEKRKGKKDDSRGVVRKAKLTRGQHVRSFSPSPQAPPFPAERKNAPKAGGKGKQEGEDEAILPPRKQEMCAKRGFKIPKITETDGDSRGMWVYE